VTHLDKVDTLIVGGTDPPHDHEAADHQIAAGSRQLQITRSR
jgi:hypothetical protein